MARVRVGLRLRFVKLPHIDGERVFRDVLAFADPDDRSYDDLRALIEAKIRFMELTQTDFTVFVTEAATGDRLVVDTSYFAALLRQWARRAAKEQRPKPQADPPLAAPALLGDSLSAVDALLPGNSHGGETPANGLFAGSGSTDVDDDDDEAPPDFLESFEVELHAAATTPTSSVALPAGAGAPTLSAVSLAALTRENLARLCEVTPLNPSVAPAAVAPAGAAAVQLERPMAVTSPGTPLSTSGPADATAAAEVLVRVRDLTCPPAHVRFYLRCVILAVRFASPKPGVTVARLDLGDAEDVRDAITAVTFDEVVHKAIREHLRGDRRQVLELRQVYVRRKNDVDVRYQTNAHPLLLRVDRSSKLEVVRILATPALQPGSAAVVTVRDQLGSAGVVDVTQLMGHSATHRQPPFAGGASAGPSSENGASLGGVVAGAFPPAFSSSSSSSGPRRTTFTMSNASGNAGASTALVSGVVPSAFGHELRLRQELLLRQQQEQRALAGLPVEPGVPVVSARDVQEREPLVEQHANREEQRKQRIRRRVETSTQCLLCGLDCDDEAACMAVVRQQLSKSSRNRGTHIPTFEHVKRDLADRRRVPEGKEATRLVCKHTFVNSTTRTVHVVHPRCAHLCAAYQAGGELEDIVLCELSMNVCALCGMPGACVACYHPLCSEMYHVVCALYSGGYVNFGQRDPFLPCAACPRHTQVVLSKRRPEGSTVLHVDHSRWEDGVAFDSRVVESTDLRDPDENDGE